MDMQRLWPHEAQKIAHTILTRHNVPQRLATEISNTLLAAQMDGCDSHGLYRLMGIVHSIQVGKVNLNARPVVQASSPNIIKVDAQYGFSQSAFKLGLPLVCEAALDQGLAALVIRRCVHFSALWVELEQIAARGLAAIAMNPTQSYVAPFGGKRALLGTNPLAFAWPRSNKDPMVFDFATSMIARGDIELQRQAQGRIPLGWGVDEHGQDCEDPAHVLDHGAMLAFGGHKGAALSLMIELLAGALIGDFTSPESTDYDEQQHALPMHGELILAFNPKVFSDDAQLTEQKAEALFQSIQDQGARIPSQRRYQNRAKSLKQGMQISRVLYDQLMALAGEGE